MTNIKKISLKALAAFLSVIMALSFAAYRPHRITSAADDKDLRAMADEIVILVNEARVEAGLKPLKAVPYLNDKARERARETIFDFSHYRPGKRVYYLTAESIFTLDNANDEQTQNAYNELVGRNCFAEWNEDMTSFRVDERKTEAVEEILIGESIDYSYTVTTTGLDKLLAEKEYNVTWSEDNKSFSIDKKYETAVTKLMKETDIKFSVGDLFITIIDGNLIPYTRAAENIAAGFDNAQDTFNQWKNSPVHWKAIMNPDYTHIGVGAAYEKDSEFRYYWEQFFVAVDGELNDQYIPESQKTVPVGSGDINGDSEINSFDLITINRYLAKETELNDLQKESADLLKDGVITSADAVVLRKYILGEYQEIPMTMDMLLGL